jgi:hypothetical protein
MEPQLLCLLEQFVCWTIELSLWPNEGTLVALGQAVAAPMTASLLEIMEQSTASEEATTEAAAAVSDPVATVQQTEAVGELGSDSAVDLPQTSVVPAVLAALAPAGNESQTQAQDDGLNMPEVNVQQANVNETNIQLPLVAFGVEVPVPNVRLFGAE